MKCSPFSLSARALTLLLIALLPATKTFSQDFQRLYGTSLDNTFSKVIQSGTNYYVLGQDQPSSGTTPHATVTRLDANGIHQWTLSLNIPSVLNDAVLTPTGDLLVVGNTLPGDATNNSLMGLVTTSGGGNFNWLRTYDVPGREGLARIIRNPNPQNASFPYYVIGSQFDANGPATWDDIILMNINAAGTFNWKKRYTSVDDDEFGRDLEVLPNGDMIISGNRQTQGVIYQMDNAGTLLNGITPSGISFSYADVAQSGNSGFYAVGNTFPSFTPYLMKYDNNLLPVWDATISGLTSINLVWEESSGGIYVVGHGVFHGLNRAVLLRFTEVANAPSLDWVKYLDNSETSYSGGSTTYLTSGQIAFVDGRTPSTGGFGQLCAFMSVSDADLLSCMTGEDFTNASSLSLLYDAPALPAIEFFDFPTGTDILSAALNWQQEDVCNSNPCNADFIITPLGSCGHYQVSNTSTGVSPLTYSWCNGSTAQDLDVILPCGPQTFCLTITDASGCTSSHAETLIVTDNVPPLARCELPFGVVLDSNCQYVLTPGQIDGGSTDNCQIQSLSISPAILTDCGVFPVTLTVTDWCGNTNTCTTMVQTTEDVPPLIRCPSNIQLSTGSPTCSMVVNGLQWTLLSDNCSTPTVTYSVTGSSNYSGTGDASGLIFDQGVSTVTYTATDDCGNTSSCSFEVNVTCICDCPGNILLNGGFYEGAIAGNNLGISGQSDHWLNGGLSPQVVKEDSCCDAYSIQMWGNYYNGESIYQQGLNIQAGHHYKISFCARYWPAYPNVNSINFGFNAASATTNPYNCQPCEQIGLSPQITSTSWGAYTMPIWIPTQNHDRIYIRAVSNTGYQSWGRIDNICIEEVPYACCGDEEAFVENADNAIHVYVDERTREAVFDAGNLPECDSITYIDWGDGNITPGPLPGNTIRRNRLLDHLLARVQYEVIEYNQDIDPAIPCFQHLFIDSLKIRTPDTCFVGGFADVIMREDGKASGQVLGCGEPPFLLACPSPGTSIVVSGLFECLGSECEEGWPIQWTLTGPGDPQSGIELADPFFSITLLPEYINQPGAYILMYSGQCGDQFFSCSTAFTVDCPALCSCTTQDSVDFATRVQRGFAMLYPENSCTVCFIPIALQDCETVQWYLNSPIGAAIGSCIGARSFCYEFQEPGDYNVVMEVSKKKDDGSKCDKQMRIQSVSPCHIPSECINPVFDNPDFTIGAIAGGLSSGGTSEGWTGAYGEPVVIEGEPGSSDGWTVQLSGNLDTGDVLSRAEGICQGKGQGLFTSTVKSSKSNSSERRPPSTLSFYIGSTEVFIRNECNSTDCYELATLTLPGLDTTAWIEIQIPYDLSLWEAVSDCGGSSSVRLRPYVYVTNTFSNDQGRERTYSFTQIDDICMRETIVSVDDPLQMEKIRIYPNPNSGQFTVEMPGPAKQGMSLRILGLAGEVLLTANAIPGLATQKVEAMYLPQGMYFIQVVSEGRVLSTNKFVKQ